MRSNYPKEFIEHWKSRWKVPYMYKGLQCVLIFLWLAFKQQILTKEERVRRGIGHDASCLVCRNEVKDILHVLRDCLATKEIWN